MKAVSQFKTTIALVGCLAAYGCGPKEDVSVAPPPSTAATAVSLDATPDPAAPATSAPAPGAAPGQVAVAPPPGEAASAGPEDMFKGMTPQQIEEFKATATPETHDMNIAPLNEAVTGFAAEFKRAPANQEELVKTRYLPRVLYPPKGKRYVIDQETMEVKVESN